VVYSRDVEIQEGVFHSDNSTKLEQLELLAELSQESESDSEETKDLKGLEILIKDKPTTTTSSRPSIIVEIPKKTADYYREFKEVNLALLLKDENCSFETLLTTLSNEPKTYKQAIQSPLKKEWLKAIDREVTKLEDQAY